MSISQHLRTATITVAVDRFLMELQVANYSGAASMPIVIGSNLLAAWCHERGVERIADLPSRSYKATAVTCSTSSIRRAARQLLPRTQSQHIVMIRCWCKWLREHDAVNFDACKTPSAADHPPPSVGRCAIG